ncbi:LacI family DNA-binding transcriptional regulator [Mycolicibacterium tokaiense]|uniref:LacI family transcriptional regulator n=1 Tax=Mycolicibacterium tokaiense TaxID=39695 RepID=A0A378TEE5_9MYCO|nr:LacI family DNA-binding transcriptional regulator [Mycolicibacterium tokaiense]BBY86319.1 LacI family transcriptional regulator [Mycolicibacterium tokaiense]STZ59172.1 LacI family transcriptional regulator [Mycolicibacterium tokaiense]
MATIREVATKAGVSPSSVTRVLSGHPNVRVELRERVLAAVREVGYEPDLVAAGLRRGYTKTVGMVVNDILNPVIAQMIDVVESELRQAGYGVLLANSHGQAKNDVENVRLLQQRRVDALLAAFSDDTNPDLPLALSALTIPVVLLDREIEPHEFSGVLSDHRGGAMLLAEHLVSRGHRDIAMISGSLTAYPSRSRVEGVEAVLARHGIPLRPELCIAGRGSEEFGSRAVTRLLEDARPPTAIIMGNGNMGATAGVIAQLRSRGVQVGQDIALAGGDDGPLLALHSPGITAIARDVEDLARRAAALVLQRMEHKRLGGHTVLLPTRLVIRPSTEHSVEVASFAS